MSTTEVQRIIDGIKWLKGALVLIFPFLMVIAYAAISDHVHFEDTRQSVAEIKPEVNTMWPVFLMEHPEQRRTKDYAKQP